MTIPGVNAQDPTGVIIDAQYRSKALEYEAGKKLVLSEDQKKLEAGQEIDIARQEAGDDELSKQEDGYLNSPKSQGSSEGVVYGEMAAHATGLVALEVAKTGYDILARGSDPAAGHGLGPKVKTMDQVLKTSSKKPHIGTGKQDPIKTKLIENIPSENIPPRIKALGKSLASKSTSVKVENTEEVGGFKLTSEKKLAMANLALEQKAGIEQAQKIGVVPAGPGGMGQGQQAKRVVPAKQHQLAHNSVASPNAPTHMSDDNTTDTDKWVS